MKLEEGFSTDKELENSFLKKKKKLSQVQSINELMRYLLIRMKISSMKRAQSLS